MGGKIDTYIHRARLEQLHLKGILEFPQLCELYMLMTFFGQGYILSNSELYLFGVKWNLITQPLDFGGVEQLNSMKLQKVRVKRVWQT